MLRKPLLFKRESGTLSDSVESGIGLSSRLIKKKKRHFSIFSIHFSIKRKKKKRVALVYQRNDATRKDQTEGHHAVES